MVEDVREKMLEEANGVFSFNKSACAQCSCVAILLRTGTGSEGAFVKTIFPGATRRHVGPPTCGARRNLPGTTQEDLYGWEDAEFEVTASEKSRALPID